MKFACRFTSCRVNAPGMVDAPTASSSKPSIQGWTPIMYIGVTVCRIKRRILREGY